MGRAKFFATAAVALVLFSQSFAIAQRPEEAIRNARSLLTDACRLRGALESARADAFTVRSACRLESTVEELIEKLMCPSHLDQAELIVDDCALWYSRTSVGVSRNCRLAEDRNIASILSCAGRQLSLLENSVACLVRHGGRPDPFQQPGFAPHQTLRPQSFPGQAGAWVNSPFGSPSGRSLGYPFGTEGLGHPAFSQPAFGQSGIYGPSYREIPQPSQRGQIARAVLELMLSEMSR